MYESTMPRPGDSINEGIESKLDLTHSLSSFDLCDSGSIFFRMNSLNNERKVADVETEAEETSLSGSDMDVSDDEATGLSMPGRSRRMALADIFENVNENDLMDLLSMYVKQEIAHMVNEKLMLRRGAKFDIFEGMTNDDVNGIVSHSNLELSSTSDSTTSNDEDGELETCAMRKRRGAKCDIFEGLTSEQQKDIVDKFYKEYMERIENCDSEKDNTETKLANTDKDTSTTRTTTESTTLRQDGNCLSQSKRRGGKFDIFEGLTEQQKLHVINLCVETICKDSEEINVAYGR